MAETDFRLLSVALAVSLVVGIGCGYMVGNSPVPGLMEEKDLLRIEYDNLARVRTSLEENYSELRTEKEDLEAEYSSLSSEYSKIESEITSLEKILTSGEAITESAEWISGDECLKGTSELIITRELWVWGIWLPETYTVRVNITNIGYKPIGKVYIFLFPYTNGEFTEKYESNTVENLYIGETYSYDFRISPETTSYKMLAVAG